MWKVLGGTLIALGALFVYHNDPLREQQTYDNVRASLVSQAEQIKPAPIKPVVLAGSTVKLMTDKGHGSAVHIGNGFFITAAHVTDGASKLSIKTDKEIVKDASLLWQNDTYDIALVKSDTQLTVETANLECRVPEKGEEMQFRGNPLSQEHVTTWGKIAGSLTSFAAWKEAVPVDASVAGGMSGGGVFDTDGDFVGVTVGGMLQSFGFSSAPVGLGVIVPGKTVCKLLARTE